MLVVFLCVHQAIISSTENAVPLSQNENIQPWVCHLSVASLPTFKKIFLMRGGSSLDYSILLTALGQVPICDGRRATRNTELHQKTLSC